MSVILNIDTALETATISIAAAGVIVCQLSNDQQKDHGSFLQPAIQTIVKDAGLQLNDIHAIAVAAGPGSYTGLRVGMASAKGLSFALQKPLITIGTLEIMAFSVASKFEVVAGQPELFCPMIDARRLEVFTALYDHALKCVAPPNAIVLQQDSFANWMLKNKINFFGNGSEKWRSICDHPNARFLPLTNNSLAMSKLAYYKYLNTEFADIAYAEPTYVKGFYGPSSP